MKNKINIPTLLFAFILFIGGSFQLSAQKDALRQNQYTSKSKTDANEWQIKNRNILLGLLKMEDQVLTKEKLVLNSILLKTTEKSNYLVQELEINSTKKRRIKIIVTVPKSTKDKLPAVVCIAGHGGDRYTVYNDKKIYKEFAKELAGKDFVTISVDVGQHEIYEINRTLMGERLWDLMRCVDFLESLPMVDKSRIGCAGLSLGGEMVMWLAAMDTRIQASVSSGFLTYMDQMEQNHCMCWKFDGLRNLVDFPDIYSMIAPRYLQCQNGMQEPPTAFTPELAKKAITEIKTAYLDFEKASNVELIIHNGGHEIELTNLLSFFHLNL